MCVCVWTYTRYFQIVIVVVGRGHCCFLRYSIRYSFVVEDRFGIVLLICIEWVYGMIKREMTMMMCLLVFFFGIFFLVFGCM